MAKSKRDPSRKEKLLKYKESKKVKMSKLPDMNLRQVPVWNSTDEFTLQGVELEALYNWYTQMAPAFMAIQQVFARGIKDQKIKVRYEREDGTQVSDDEVKSYTEQLNAYFKKRAAEKNDEKLDDASYEAMSNESAAIAKESGEETKVIQM